MTRLLYIALGMLIAVGCGCRAGAPLGLVGAAPALAVGNPIYIAGGDREFVYEQVVDAIDDYFKIQSERRMQLVGNIVTPGRVDTFPVIGATVLEPWRADFGLGPETLHNTLQTIRRFAIVEMIPDGGGYLISVNVMKEMEDVSQPDSSTVGGATLRHDGTLVRTKEKLRQPPVTLGWIPLGRDTLLEERILLDIQSRLTGT